MAKISGFIFEDVNHDNTYEEGVTPGIENVSLAIVDEQDNGITVTSKKDGFYEAEELSAGKYKVYAGVDEQEQKYPPEELIMPAGYTVASTARVKEVVLEEEQDKEENFGFDNLLTFEKESNVKSAVPGDIIDYSIKVSNPTKGVDLESVIVSDPLDPSLEFVKGSVKIDNISKPNASIITGVEAGPLAIGEEKEITFKAEVKAPVDGEAENKLSKEEKNQIVNTSTAVYTFEVDGQTQIRKQESNENVIDKSVPLVDVTKTADKTSAELDEEITYVVEVVNNGDTTVTNVLYKDELPLSVELVEDSFMIDGKVVQNIDLSKGVNIGTLNPGDAIEITYKVKVVAGSCSGFISNKAYTEYNYVLPDGTTGKKQSDISEAEVEAAISIFRQITLDSSCHIPAVKPPVDEVDGVSIEVEITNSYVIQTMNTLSNEGQRLTGYKLVVHGILKVILEYTAMCKEQSMHSAHYDIPFSSFIILPTDYVMGMPVEVSAIVENSDTEILGPKEVFINVALLLLANAVN